MPPKAARCSRPTSGRCCGSGSTPAQMGDRPDRSAAVHHRPGAPATTGGVAATARRRTTAVDDTAWPVNPIDNFILPQLKRAGLRPSPGRSANDDPPAVVRSGRPCPPHPRTSRSSSTIPTLALTRASVDRLLDSLTDGERWARHWLDMSLRREPGIRAQQAAPNA